jgi:hypothetical protein
MSQCLGHGPAPPLDDRDPTPKHRGPEKENAVALDVNETHLGGALTLHRVGSSGRPGSYTGSRDEYLAGRTAAWLAEEGREVTDLWGDEGWPTSKLRARVARLPHYNGEYRAQTFDTSAVPRPPQAAQ